MCIALHEESLENGAQGLVQLKHLHPSPRPISMMSINVWGTRIAHPTFFILLAV